MIVRLCLTYPFFTGATLVNALVVTVYVRGYLTYFAEAISFAVIRIIVVGKVNFIGQR